MKKVTVLRSVLSLALAAFLLCGCGNSTDETTASENVPEVVEPVEASNTEEKEEQEIQQPDEAKTPAEEEVAEEPKEEETSTDMPEAQVTTTVENIDGLVAYMEALDSDTPHIVIYNEAEGYIIDMEEGEHYQLKSDDRIFLNSNSKIKQRTHAMPEIKYEPISGAQEIIPDYSQFNKPHQCAYGILCEDSTSDELTYLVCYLTAPSE